MDLVLYHHNHTKSNYPDLCSILKKADHHSASEREDIDDTQEVNKTPLISLFSKIVLEGNGKVDEQYIPLNKLSLDDGSFNNLKPAAKKNIFTIAGVFKCLKIIIKKNTNTVLFADTM